MATFAVWLLISLTSQQQSSPSVDKDTAQQQTGKASKSVTLPGEKKPPHEETATAGQQQHGSGTVAQPSVSPKCFAERMWQWLKSLNNADKISLGLFLVTACYLAFTIKIWKQMVTSNKHAEKTYNESKSAAEEDRKLLRSQLEAYDRPWITGSIVFKEPITFEPDGSAQTLLYPVVKNVGKSVAIDISPTCKWIVIPRGTPDFLSFVTERMEALLRDSAPKNVGSLFPGDSNERTMIRVGVTSEEIATGSFSHDGAARVSVVCICAIFYRFANSTADHVTRFAYHMGQSNAFRTGGDMNIRIGTRIQSSEIITLTHPFSYAD